MLLLENLLDFVSFDVLFWTGIRPDEAEELKQKLYQLNQMSDHKVIFAYSILSQCLMDDHEISVGR